MADLAQIEKALRAADAAGNTEDARRLAQAYAAARGNEFPAGDSRNQPAALTITPSSTPKPNAFVDSVRSTPGGLAQGVAGLVGLPGDIESGLNAGADWIMEKLGADPQRMEAMRQNREQTSTLPTSAGINRTISEPFGGYYEPKTLEGQYTQTVAQFAPAMLAPGSLLTRFARMAVPAVASETAGQATKGTAFEPLARAGGALAGGVGLGMAEGVAAARGVPKTPSGKELKAAKDAAYKAVDDAGVTFSGDRFRDFAKGVAAQADEAGIDPTLHPKATAALKRLAEVEGDPTFKKVETLRRVANGALDSVSKDERRIAYIIRDGLDDFVESMDEASVLSGDIATAAPSIRQARALNTRMSKNDVIERAIEKAKNRQEMINTSGLDNAIRIEFRKIAQNDRAMRRFSKEEQEAIKTVARGTTGANIARRAGTFAPTGLKGLVASGMGTNIGGALGGALGGPPGALAGGALGGATVAGVGAGGRRVADAITSRNAQLAAELMRRGAPLPQNSNSAALATALLLSQAGN